MNSYVTFVYYAAAKDCETNPTRDVCLRAKSAAYAADASAYAAAYADAAAAAAYAAAARRDKILSIAADIGVAALRKVGAMGIKWMDQLIP